MEAVRDPFQPLLHLIGRYRQDIHYLRPPPSAQAFPTIQAHIGPLPEGLSDFLHRWNGANLFKGSLRLRALTDLAPAAAEHPEVILFADGPGPGDRWGYARVEGGFHFGRWEGNSLRPLHEDFHRWLLAQARMLDEQRTDESAQLALRIEVDPDDGLLLTAAGEQLMMEGDGDAALKCFHKAVARSPELPHAWQRLGEALLSVDRTEARNALLMALRCTRLPLPYAGAPVAERDLFRLLEAHFPAGDPGWERELGHFLSERATDIHREEEADVLEAAALAWMRCRLARGGRQGARALLAQVRDRASAFTCPPLLPDLQLQLCRMDTDLGNHDEAEEQIRQMRAQAPVLRARALLALARIAHIRDEPWVEEILDEALSGEGRAGAPGAGGLTDEADRAEVLLIRIERGGWDLLPEALRLARGLQDTGLLARCALLSGDRAREGGNHEGARSYYNACSTDPETWLRARVRLGDLSPGAQEAAVHYRAAIEGFQTMQLPMREAWARLRMARLGDESQLDPALKLFRSASLPTGVAAVDSLRGSPGAHLPWHLNLAADYARQRHDAQRLRPPWTRADADRPERRLLAHRAAIAACDSRMVAALSEQMRADLLHVRRADLRVQGPPAMRFLAMADLLAGHPSWEAARELLHFLREDVPNEAVSRGLTGALIRSPNMSLVQLLLDSLKEGQRPDPTTLARTIEILGWRREPEAIGRIMQLAATGSLPVRKAAITALGRLHATQATDLLLGLIDAPDLAEAASVSLLLLGEWQGVDFHGQALARRQFLQRPAGEIVGRFGGPNYLLLLLSLLDREGVAGIGAMQGLGLMGNVRAVPRLIEIVGDRDPARANVAGAALALLTGHSEDLEAPHPRLRWSQWWDANGGRFSEGARYREGRPLTVRRLMERLGHDDPAARLSGYDELAISTGQRLPFDSDGPWRIQIAHRRAWDRWYADNAHLLPQSGWLFHGRAI